MSASVRITTPEVQIQDGNARMQSLQLNGDKSRKSFTLEAFGAAGATAIVNITLTQGGTGSAFSLIPGTTGGTASVFLISGRKSTFFVDYDSSKGTGVTASIISSLNVQGLSGPIVLGPTASIDFTVSGPQLATKRDLGPLLSMGEDGVHIIQESTHKITQDETSFGLIRTNPKLSGNVKLTVDSDQNIWLNSIDATPELADYKYKKFKLSSQSSYAVDVYNFFDLGTTPPEIVYNLYEETSNYTSTKRDFSEQFDRFYHYGVTQLIDKYYDEDYSFFAPLYLKTEIPDYFVIFRTPGPVNNFSYEQSAESWKYYVDSEILKDSQIIKVFDMSENSPIGQYLRKIVSHPSRRESEITVSYQKDGYTTYNGISYEAGTFVEAGELLADFIEDENPLITTEEHVTLGFERNKVVSSHLMNLEFLFSDEDAELYTINRYFGFYVNAIDLATFSLNSNALLEFSLENGQTPLPRKNVDGTKVSQKSFVQTNTDGIKIYADATDIVNVPELPKTAFSSVVTGITGSTASFSLAFPGKFDDKLSTGETITFTSGGVTVAAKVSSFTYSDEKTSVSLNSFTGNITFVEFLTNTWTANFYNDEKYELYKRKVFDNAFASSTSRFFYIKDNTNFLNSVKTTSETTTNVDAFTEEPVIELALKDTKIDISHFTGFTDVLTQTKGKYLNKGRSCMEVKVLNYFNPNDYLEIGWKTPPVAGYPSRWRIVANNSNLNPGETWPSYSIMNDSEGEYYVTYFNSGNKTITLSVFTASLREAFDNFIGKNFEVVSKEDKLYFRSTQEGKVSNQAELKFNFQESSTISIMGVVGENIGKVNFVGGSDRNRTRVRISKDVAEGMLLDEYVSTKGNFQLAKRYDILGETVMYSPYLEEPVYDEIGEKLIDFLGSEDYAVISVDDETTEIELTYDSLMTSYELFRPSYGVLSVLPLKDFDTDFYFSDYSKTYTSELVEYFGRSFPAAKILSITGPTATPLYTFNKTFNFSSYPQYVPYLVLSESGLQESVLYNETSQFYFGASGNTASLYYTPSATQPTVGQSVLMMPGNKAMYYSEELLSSFKGFLTLSSRNTPEDEVNFSKKQNLWDPTRFQIDNLDNEYSRMSENYLKNLVLTSRVVPYIMKWVSPQGKDVRSNPYRMNYHRVFGNMNFSPSETLVTPNPSFHTHEWPYLDSVPYDFPISKYPESTFSYFYEELNDRYDFTSQDRDWFSAYFTVGYPVEKYKNSQGNYVSAILDPVERYSYFNFEDFSGETFTFFRGFKFKISEIDEETGEVVQMSEKYNNYRFSAIMKTVEEDPSKKQDPVEFKTIVNEKWKFIVLIITIRASSYRFPKGNLKYVDLYTFQNSNDLAYYTYDSSFSVYLPGFYKASATDKKLSASINLSAYSKDTSLSAPADYYDAFDSDAFYIDDLSTQILPTYDGSFSDIVTVYDLLGFQVSTTNPRVTTVYDFNTVKLSGKVSFVQQTGTSLSLSIPIPYSTIPWNDHIFYHASGGNNSLIDISERTSFSEILNVMTGTSLRDTMIFEVYKGDGSSTSVPNFSIQPVSPEKLLRTFEYLPVRDENRPPAYNNVKDVAAVLVEEKDLQTIYRYQGDFSPKFRDLLKFTLRESESFTNINNRDFLLCNTQLAESLQYIYTMRNQFYNKVATTEVLSLAGVEGYQPVYPLIDEIAIDKKDNFIWASSWDNSYYRLYTSKKDFTSVKGTFSMKEEKSYLGSKVMKVPTKYDLFQYTPQKLTNANQFNTTSSELAYFVSGNSVIIQVDVYNRLSNEMFGTDTDPRARTEFLKLATTLPEAFSGLNLSTYSKNYIQENLMPLYDISLVKLYVLETSAKTTRPLIEVVDGKTLSETQLQQKNYAWIKSATVRQISNFKFQIVYNLDKRFYTSLAVGVEVTRI